MTNLRKALLAAIASAVVATTFSASYDSAQAFPREGMQQHRHIGNGHRGHFHRGHGGWGNFGTGLAIGLGTAIIGQAIAEAARPAEAVVVVPRVKRAVRKAPGMTAQQKRDCDLVKQWDELIDSAERLLERDRELHKKYGEAVHSIEHVRFQEKELERRKEERRKAKARCAGRVAAR